MTDPLPGVLGEIEQAAGHGPALALAGSLGGTLIYIPVDQERMWAHLRRVFHHLPTVWSDLAASNLDRLAAELVRARGGESVYVPQARPHLGCHLARHGHSAASIARIMGVSHRTALRYRRAIKNCRGGTNV